MTHVRFCSFPCFLPMRSMCCWCGFWSVQPLRGLYSTSLRLTSTYTNACYGFLQLLCSSGKSWVLKCWHATSSNFAVGYELRCQQNILISILFWMGKDWQKKSLLSSAQQMVSLVHSNAEDAKWFMEEEKWYMKNMRNGIWLPLILAVSGTSVRILKHIKQESACN